MTIVVVDVGAQSCAEPAVTGALFVHPDLAGALEDGGGKSLQARRAQALGAFDPPALAERVDRALFSMLDAGERKIHGVGTPTVPTRFPGVRGGR